MYEDFNRNEMNMIGAYLMQYYDINEKRSKTDDYRKI